MHACMHAVQETCVESRAEHACSFHRNPCVNDMGTRRWFLGRGGAERERGTARNNASTTTKRKRKPMPKPAKSPLWAASWPTLMAGPGRVNASVAAPSASRRKTWRARWQCRTGCIGCSPPACMSTWIMYQCICMHVYANTRASARTHEHIGVGDCNVPFMAAGLTRAR